MAFWEHSFHFISILITQWDPRLCIATALDRMKTMLTETYKPIDTVPWPNIAAPQLAAGPDRPVADRQISIWMFRQQWYC